MTATTKLPLTSNERGRLRKNKIKLNEVHYLEIDFLSNVLEVPNERALELRGLAQFQQVPTIGIKLAEKLVNHLKLYSLEEMKKQDGAKLFDQLEERLGVWTDSCVEDQIRCVIHYARKPNNDIKWHDFTQERKSFREKHGYPKTRPTKAWYE
ncbi:helix-hairpin-helix domain-containing protein [Alkalibacillus haloalkaliphilus]|uniref:Pathogenicity locus n=1 Tax=Alkalibacillus haloalkaliphilus TaxID=94136 RepID=A0A511W2Y1_9BACI|nr:helix-hairpin-helix domain-containing protein [Alkalibacillus haloalkaliphilus]GEN45446.1 hypothetical protein AHA02nite_12220 [Alkalibacillus haloalkaliphilus]